MMMSSTKIKEIHVNYSILISKNLQKGKTTAVIAVIRGKPKDGCHHQRSNKHKIVRVLLDSGSD
jgi:hypothetical protein